MSDFKPSTNQVAVIVVQKGPDHMFRVLVIGAAGVSLTLPHFSAQPLQSVVVQGQNFISEELFGNSTAGEFTYISKFLTDYNDPELGLTTHAMYFAPQKQLSFKTDSLAWQTFPDFLRSMPKNKGRTVFLKAWQTLLGVEHEDIKALESDQLKPLN